MKFVVTPDEAQRLARAMIRNLKKQKMKVSVEKAAWPNAPYRTTIVAEKSGRHVLIEAQGVFSYGRSLKDLASWLAANRKYAELYIVTTTDASSEVGILAEMKTDGVGLFTVEADGSVNLHHNAKNQALIVNPDPTLRYGAHSAEINSSIRKFNEVNRKDGLRDMCEIAERLTRELGILACRKGILKIPEGPFKAKDWSSQINELARPDAYNSPHRPVISDGLKTDMHSFRGARNLVDHPTPSKRESASLEKQFAERMMQGPRIVADLITAIRRTKKL